MTSPAPIQDKAPKPPGLLPKNVQSWLLISLAVLMVVIMWLTGGKKPVTPSRIVPLAPAVQAPLEVNEAKIVDLQNRIQELQREQVIAQNALAQNAAMIAIVATTRPTLRHRRKSLRNKHGSKFRFPSCRRFILLSRSALSCRTAW